MPILKEIIPPQNIPILKIILGILCSHLARLHAKWAFYFHYGHNLGHILPILRLGAGWSNVPEQNGHILGYILGHILGKMWGVSPPPQFEGLQIPGPRGGFSRGGSSHGNLLAVPSSRGKIPARRFFARINIRLETFVQEISAWGFPRRWISARGVARGDFRAGGFPRGESTRGSIPRGNIYTRGNPRAE